MEHVHRFWTNTRWGWGRRVVKIYIDGDRFRVEAIEGSDDKARVRSWNPPREEDALQLADELMGDQEGWQELKTPTKSEGVEPRKAPPH